VKKEWVKTGKNSGEGRIGKIEGREKEVKYINFAC